MMYWKRRNVHQESTFVNATERKADIYEVNFQ